MLLDLFQFVYFNFLRLKTMETISLKEYGRRVGCKENFKTLQEIQDYVEEYHDCTLWDYPLEEADYCKEEDRKVVLVNTDFGLRLCEI